MNARLLLTVLSMVLPFSLSAAGEDRMPELGALYVASHPNAVAAMLELAAVTNSDYVMDLGCGDGRIVIAAAKTHGARGLGVDLDAERVRESRRNAVEAGVTNRVEFRKADLMETDLREASVVALFLSEEVNVRLLPKLLAELKPGTRVVSNGFGFGDWKPDAVVDHADAYDGAIDLWIVPARVAGAWAWHTAFAGGSADCRLDLTQEFQAVRGTITPAGAAPVPITDVALAGKELRFTASIRVGAGATDVVYRGIVDGGVVRGCQDWHGGPWAGTHPWLAARAAPVRH